MSPAHETLRAAQASAVAPLAGAPRVGPDPGETGLPNCSGRTECAHVKTRGAGGQDVANTIPLCTKHHREQHRIGIKSFEQKYGHNLANMALHYGGTQPPEIGRKRIPFMDEYAEWDRD